MQVFSKDVAPRRREMAHTLILVGVDLVAVVAAFEIGRALRGSLDRPFAHVISQTRYLEILLATLPLWVAIFAICGLYKVPVNGGRVSEVGRVMAAVFGGVMLLMSIAYLSYHTAIFPSRLVAVYALFFGIPLVVIGRQIVRAQMKRWFRQGRGRHNVILIGTGAGAERIVEELTAPWSGYQLIGGVRTGGVRQVDLGGAPVYDSLMSALAANSDVRLDEIIQADLNVPRNEAVRMMAYANEHGVSYSFVPDKYGVYAAASKFQALNGIPMLQVRLTALDGWGAIGKRIFDLVGAILLLIAFSPVLVALAVIIKISEPGAPVLYKQRRIGFGGREIRVWKFRSMLWKYSTGPDREFKTAEDALRAMGHEELILEFQVNQKLDDDPRVSRLGGFLRKSSLDELPQLFNALSGSISLVGPRPITPDELARYGEQATSFLALKPGITGLWQVYGRSDTTYEERVKLDIYYVENWSVGLDVSILARTLVSVTTGKGAS